MNKVFKRLDESFSVTLLKKIITKRAGQQININLLKERVEELNRRRGVENENKTV